MDVKSCWGTEKAVRLVVLRCFLEGLYSEVPEKRRVAAAGNHLANGSAVMHLASAGQSPSSES